MAAEPHVINSPATEDKDATLFLESKADSPLASEHSAEYREYLRLENEVYIGKAKKKLLRKVDIRVVLPLVVRGLSSKGGDLSVRQSLTLENFTVYSSSTSSDMLTDLTVSTEAG